MKSKIVFSLIVVLLVLLSAGKCQSQEWIPYVPTSQSVSLNLWILDGISYINVSIAFDDPCYEVDWGTVAREDNEIWVDSMIWDWTGNCIDIPTTLSQTYDLSLVEEGNYTFTFMAWNVSVKSLSFTFADTRPPAITILSPENRTYYIPPPSGVIILIYPPPPPQTCVPLNFTVDEMTSWAGYSLNGQANVTVIGNTTLVGLLLGTYSVIVHANDTYGNMGSSEAVCLTVRLLGDVNGDGKISVLDIVMVAVHFGMKEGDPGWNPDTDLTQDGVINILEILIIARCFFLWN